jgi:hypothetical protein
LYIDTQNAIIENNLIVRVGAYGIHNYGQPCGSRISNNTIINAQYGMTISGGGENICTPGNVTVDNNIMVGLTKGVIGQISQMPCTDATHQSFFGHNISDGAVPDFVNAPTTSCNTLSPSSGFIHASGSSLFVNYQTNGSGNYQLSGTSPAINAGSTVCVVGGASPCIPSFDILNVTRPQRAGPDAGAYELP